MRWRIDNKCLSLSKVQAEMTRGTSRRPSAFSFETFSCSTFDSVMAEEGVEAEAEAITHAATQARAQPVAFACPRCLLTNARLPAHALASAIRHRWQCDSNSCTR